MILGDSYRTFITEKYQFLGDIMSLLKANLGDIWSKCGQNLVFFRDRENPVLVILPFQSLSQIIQAATWELLLFAYVKTKAQISCMVTAQLISSWLDSTIISLCHKIRNFKPLAIFRDHTAWFVSDLVGNHEERFSRDPTVHPKNSVTLTICCKFLKY